MKSKSKSTPIRSSLEKSSSLHSEVKNGIGALQNAHRNYLADDIRRAFADSLDLDKAMQEGHEQEHRWDYLLGHTPSAAVVALEPHSARGNEITTVIKKKDAAKQQLKGHLRSGARVNDWLWVASGTVYFADTEKACRRLDQRGIQFVGRKVLEKHLPGGKMKG